MRNRRKYTKEFKLGAISLIKEQGYSVVEACRNLEIPNSVLNRWIREHEKDSTCFRGNGKLTADQLEIRRLKEENRRLKMEKEILKKAAAFFAKETH